MFRVNDWCWIVPSGKSTQKVQAGKISALPGKDEALVQTLPDINEEKTIKNIHTINELLDTPPLHDEISVKVSDLLPIDTYNLTGDNGGYADMVTMPQLTAPEILHNLRKRYYQKSIYTTVSSILISVNPYQKLDMYGADKLNVYSAKGEDSFENQTPHIYTIARNAFRNMFRDAVDQSVLISGESGAGKTEATKFVLHYLIHSSGTGQDIDVKLVNANPILESFGNAMTTRNDNSSRFGRWTSIIFDVKSGKIVGGKLLAYLLEENRVTVHNQGERNYHVLYQACQCKFDKKQFSDLEPEELTGLDPKEFNYLMHMFTKIDGVDDRVELTETLSAMTKTGMSFDIQREIFRLLKAILYIGNIDLIEIKDPVSQVMVAGIAKEEQLLRVARLLGVDPDRFKEFILKKTLKVNANVIEVPLTLEQAIGSRDALAKTLYSRLFDWIIAFINKAIECREFEEQGDLPVGAESKKPPFLTIGVLDIFGFEQFKLNGIEQFLINYANERLQQHFLNTIFKIELELYKREGIDVSDIEFADNAQTLELLHGKPNGVLPTLEDCLSMPKMTHIIFTSKVVKGNEGHPSLIVRKSSDSEFFTVVHYAAPVEYFTGDFLERSRNKLNEELLEVARDSDLSIVSMILSDGLDLELGALPQQRLGRSNSASVDELPSNRISRSASVNLEEDDQFSPPPSSTRGRSINETAPDISVSPAPLSRKSIFETRSASSDTSQKGSIAPRMEKQKSVYMSMKNALRLKKSKAKSIGMQFSNQLTQLMEMISCTQSHFVRCIKPNTSKSKSIFDADMIREQLANSGMLETIKVRKHGFPERFPFSKFVSRYQFLEAAGKKGSKPTKIDEKQRCINIIEGLNKGLKDKGVWAQCKVGNTQVFMKSSLLPLLENRVSELLSKHVLVIQKNVRRFVKRKLYKRTRVVYRDILIASKELDQPGGVSKFQSCLKAAKSAGIPPGILKPFEAQLAAFNNEGNLKLMKAKTGQVSTLQERVALLNGVITYFSQMGLDEKEISWANQSKQALITFDEHLSVAITDARLLPSGHLTLKELLQSGSTALGPLMMSKQTEDASKLAGELAVIGESLSRCTLPSDPSTMDKETQQKVYTLNTIVTETLSKAAALGIPPDRVDTRAAQSVLDASLKEKENLTFLKEFKVESATDEQVERLRGLPPTVYGLTGREAKSKYESLLKGRTESLAHRPKSSIAQRSTSPNSSSLYVSPPPSSTRVSLPVLSTPAKPVEDATGINDLILSRPKMQNKRRLPTKVMFTSSVAPVSDLQSTSLNAPAPTISASNELTRTISLLDDIKQPTPPLVPVAAPSKPTVSLASKKTMFENKSEDLIQTVKIDRVGSLSVDVSSRKNMFEKTSADSSASPKMARQKPKEFANADSMSNRLSRFESTNAPAPTRPIPRLSSRGDSVSSTGSSGKGTSAKSKNDEFTKELKRAISGDSSDLRPPPLVVTTASTVDISVKGPSRDKSIRRSLSDEKTPPEVPAWKLKKAQYEQSK